MKFIKCPRCELNYIREDEGYCPVCKREMKGERHDDVELCSICNENPVIPGRDICIECLKEMNAQRQSNDEDTNEGEVDITMEDVTEMEDVAEMEEIDIDTMEDEDVPEEIGNQISLEEEQSKELDADENENEDRFEDN